MTRFAILNPARTGRPRDPQMEGRVFRAALDLYGEAGWTGFNPTKIAAEAGVDKSSLYSRWNDHDELLHHAFTALMICPGSRGDFPWEILVNEADFRLREYLGPNRSTIRRLLVEAGNAEDPVICQIYRGLFITPLSATHKRLQSFKLNSKLPRNTSVVRLLDAIEGGVLMRTFCLPDGVIAYFLEKVPACMTGLIDNQLHHHKPSRQLDE